MIMISHAEESKFWGDIWSQLVDHNRDVKWLKDLQREANVTKQEKEDIRINESLKKIFGRIQNWKSTGPDIVQGFWLNFCSLLGRERSQLKKCLYNGFVPGWLTKGKTTLLQKDKSKGDSASIDI